MARAWQTENKGLESLKLVERPDLDRAPGPGEVAVRVKANAINYRDLMTVLDPAARAPKLPLIPNSDGAGFIDAVGPNIGPGVDNWAVGDRVAGCFFQN